MLPLYKMKQILNPYVYTEPQDDFRVLDSWVENGKNINTGKNELKYMCYKIQTVEPSSGKKITAYKAIKFARVDRIPKAMKQSTSFMDMQSQVLSACHQQNYNLITIIANVIRPVTEGLLYLYGIQGVANTIEEAKKICREDYEGFVRSMMGTFRVLHLRNVSADEAAWLHEKMRGMKYLTAVRGIPKASKSGEDAGNKGIGGANVNPDSQGTLEEIITAMADYEYVIEILSTAVMMSTIRAWSTQIEKEMTAWNEQLQGTKSLSANLSLPITYMTSAGQATGWSRSATDSRTVSYNTGESYSTGYSQNVGHSLSQSLGESFGINHGNSLTRSTGTSYSVSNGQTVGKTSGVTNGITKGQTIGETMGVTNGITKGYTQGITQGRSSGTSVAMSRGTSVGFNSGASIGKSTGSSQNQSFSSGLNQGLSKNLSNSVSFGSNKSVNNSSSYSQSYGDSSNMSHSVGAGTSDTYGNSQTSSVGGAHSRGQGAGVNFGQNRGYNGGMSGNASLTFGNNNGDGASSTKTHTTSINESEANGKQGHREGDKDVTKVDNAGGGFRGSTKGLTKDTADINGFIEHEKRTTTYDTVAPTYTETNTESRGYTDATGTGNTKNNSDSISGTAGLGWNTSMSGGANYAENYSANTSDSTNYSNSLGRTESHGSTTNESYSAGTGHSYGENYGASYGTSNGISFSNGKTTGTGESIGRSSGVSGGYGVNTGASYGRTTGASTGSTSSVSVTHNSGTSISQSLSQSLSQSQSISNSQSLSNSLSNSYSESLSNSQSLSKSVSQGQNQSTSVGETTGESYGKNISNGTGQTWGEGTSESMGRTSGKSTGLSTGTSLGKTYTSNLGASGSMGIGPSIGYSKSYQWLDQQVKDILEVLDFQNERMKKAIRQGAFYTYVYIACPDTDVLAAAQAAARSTWQNSYALAQPIQALDLTMKEQQHLLSHFSAFSADVTRENFAGQIDYKYATILTADEYVSYTHLPRISEGGIDADIEDIPHFRVPGLMKGNIYMGKQLSAERFTFNNGYRTQFDYRINIDELMHGVFTGQSRSGKTVAAMRFVRELINSRRSATGKRLRIVVMDPKQDWRGIARFVEPERFHFYSMGNPHFEAINLNPCKIPVGTEPQYWVDGIINIYCRAYGLLERGKQMLSDTFYRLYEQAGVFGNKADHDQGDPATWHKNDGVWTWADELSYRSGKVTFHKIYKDMDSLKSSAADARAGNDTKDAFARLCERLSCFARPYAIEYRLFSAENDFDDPNSFGLGQGIDELIGADDVTVFESFGLESTFANFIFGVITSGFYKVAKSIEGGYLNPNQYETVLVIEEANKVLTGNDAAGSSGKGGSDMSLSGQSEFEEILDQSAGYGLFVIAITQKIGMMPSSIVANCGMLFAGKLSQPTDVDLVVRMIGREGRVDDRDVVKFFPKIPTGWFICRSNRGFDFRDAEPVLVQIEPLNNASISNDELEEILTMGRLAAVRRKMEAA